MTIRSSRHLVEPALGAMLDALPTVNLTAELLPMMRSRPPWLPVDPADLARTLVIERLVPGPPGQPEVPVRLYRPVNANRPLPCILHVHGGGFMAGRAADLAGVHLPLAADLGCCIVSIDYRLAPENPFPAGVEDCYAALRWVFAHAADLAIDRARIGVMGESAGGGLAAALALLARDRGEYSLAFQHLTYPMLDDRTGTAGNPHPYAGEFVWAAASNRFGWSALLGRGPAVTTCRPTL